MYMNKNKEKLRGFTLIELLVVISIIALLMAVMMPALSRAKQLAMGVVCKSRLKDIGVASNTYIMTNNGYVPAEAIPGERWMTKLGGYIYDRQADNYTQQAGEGGIYDFELFRCPLEERKSKKKGFDDQNILIDAVNGLYGMNQFFTGEDMQPNRFSVLPNNTDLDNCWRRFDSINMPSTLPFFADTNSDGDPAYGVPDGKSGVWWLSAKGPHPFVYSAYNYDGGAAAMPRKSAEWAFYGPAANHNKKTNYLMADGHTEGMDIWPWRDHKGTDFHPKRNVKVKPPAPPKEYFPEGQYPAK
jgi:prepilin-type N-terminal cleavage/methylation domain-containing protein/prepilin-type processing-associated H-X9-DG protein